MEKRDHTDQDRVHDQLNRLDTDIEVANIIAAVGNRSLAILAQMI